MLRIRRPSEHGEADFAGKPGVVACVRAPIGFGRTQRVVYLRGPHLGEKEVAAMKICSPSTSTIALPFTFALLTFVAGPALAQTDPKFEFGKAEAVKTVEWKAQAKGGLLLTTGNSQTTNGNAGVLVSRKEAGNKVAFEGALAYGKSSVLAPVFGDPANPTQITGLDEHTVETTNSWLTRGRYDRFFTANNAGYATAQAASDKIAGKSFYGGGQGGYSPHLVKNDLQLLVAELRYDFSSESYEPQPGKTLHALSMHSARR